MIIGLAIVLMIILIWSIFSFIIISDDDFSLTDINLRLDGLLITIAKLYWIAIIVIVTCGILFVTSYALSYTIVCDSTNNDYPQCVKENKNG